jgi:hypothetical protein
MLDAKSVITTVTEGFVEELARRREISERRMYELLGRDCAYPKAKRLIRDIAQINPSGARLIKADMDAMWSEILDHETGEVTDAEMNRELNQAMQARLEAKSRSERLKECREAIGILQREIVQLESDELPAVRRQMADAVGRRSI